MVSDAREKVLNDFELLVYKYANKYAYYGAPLEDLLQEGRIALYRSYEKFDERKGVKFITFATNNIIGSMKSYLRDRASLIRHPRDEASIDILSLDVPIGETTDLLTDLLPCVTNEDDIIHGIDIGVALSQLAQEERYDILEYVVNGVSQGELGMKHGCSKAWVNSRMLKNLKKVKSMMIGQTSAYCDL